MKQVEISHGNVFERTKKAYDDGNRVIIQRGGTGSGKSYDLTIFIIYLCLAIKNKIFTVVSESVPHLEIGVIRIFEAVMKSTDLYEPSRYNSTQKRYTFPNGSILEFFSADRIGKALGARRFLLYGNEINNLKFEVFDELSRRSEVIIADFNPTSEFWLEQFLSFYGGVVQKSNYLDNPFLPKHEVERILRRSEVDANFKRIHIDAEYGNYEGLIYTNWQTCDNVPEGSVLMGYGLDFGYTNDPSALIGIYKHKGEHYVHELIYQTGMLSGDFIRIMRQLGVSTSKPIFADSADPRLIDEIKRGGYNIKPVKKEGLDESIDFVKKYLKYVTKQSTNTIKELRNYSWINKDGKYINVPIDSFNHSLDALRYGCIGLYGKSGIYII